MSYTLKNQPPKVKPKMIHTKAKSSQPKHPNQTSHLPGLVNRDKCPSAAPQNEKWTLTTAFMLLNLPSIDGHVIQIHLGGEPAEQLHVQEIQHMQNPLAGQTCLSELSLDSPYHKTENVAELLLECKHNQPGNMFKQLKEQVK